MHLLYLYNKMTSLYLDSKLSVMWTSGTNITHSESPYFSKETKDTVKYSVVWRFSKHVHNINPLKYVKIKFLVYREHRMLTIAQTNI